ncbi:uncharacterized protein LOC106173347 [Lingula anatina]|uniref:Uncharacterized protein LOC106173347 n=1 Tax=Lingula anatina TaxID=7574 RepID=A0A1S3JIE6_LINAN|nr:uncharacterized protein LOC106173347 [Lingula anatina]|eukprot:XP_013409911.1 uncharacterized protein LOC106173347 [Lingula anatina]
MMEALKRPRQNKLGVSTSLVLFSLWLLSLLGGARAVLTAEQLQELRRFVNTTLQCKGDPAFALSIVHDGNVLLSEGYGIADLETQREVTSSTAFPIGSLTKGFAAVLLAQLLAGKNITWTTPITRYLDQSFRFADDILNKEVSLEDILSHRTGLESVLLPLFMGWPENKDRTEVIRALMKGLRTKAPLRTSFSYNNYLYGLAGVIAEQLSGAPRRSWEDLIAQFILQPLRLANTGFVQDVQEGDLGGFAFPYVKIGGEKRLVDMIYTTAKQTMHLAAAGAMYSTADDMAKWLNFLISGGKDESGNFLVGDHMLFGDIFNDHMHNPQPFSSVYSFSKPSYPFEDYSHSYGFGWLDARYRGFRKIWHSGSISTYMAVLYIFPHMRTGLFSVTSSNDGDSAAALYSITSYASDLLLGERTWLNESTVCDFKAKWSQEMQVNFLSEFNSSRPLEAYVGTYIAEPWPTIEVYVNETDTMLHMTMGAIGHLLLYPTAHADTFLGKYLDYNFYLSESDYFQMAATIQFKQSTDGPTNIVDTLLLPPENSPMIYRLLTAQGGTWETGTVLPATECATMTRSGHPQLQSINLLTFTVFIINIITFATW